MIKARISLFLSFLLTITSIAQNTMEQQHLPQETIFVHYNTNLILTGEKLYYKIYNLTTKNQLSPFSKIAYIEVIDETNKSLFKQKLNLENGVASSDIFIPTTIKTGSYKLVAYTQWMLNEHRFFEDTIYIINPFQQPENTTKIDGVITVKKANPNSLITTNKKTYVKREKVTLNLVKENLIGNFSLSVRKVNPNDFPSKKEVQTSMITSKTTSQDLYLPELRGDLVYGTITTKNTSKNINGKKIGLSSVEENPFSLIATTNKNGEFYFHLKNNTTPNLFFQVLEKDRDEYTLTIKENNSFNSTLNGFPKIPLTQNLFNLIKERSMYLQVENSYNSVKQDLILSPTKKQYIFNKHAITYILDDYTRFKTLKEVATEILNDVWYTHKKEQFSLHVRDHNLETNTSIPPLVIVDGYIVYNHNEILNYDAMQIEKIAIVTEKYVYGGNLYQGILNIKTFKNNYQPNSKFVKEVAILKPERLKKYFYQDHSNKNKTNRIPDYRTQLLWQPNLNTTNYEVSFYTSDIAGDFEIEIVGISSEGKSITYKQYFTVN